MRKILGVNISHNVSFAYFEDNILKEYYEEDRFNKEKHWGPEGTEIRDETYEYHVLKKLISGYLIVEKTYLVLIVIKV